MKQTSPFRLFCLVLAIFMVQSAVLAADLLEAGFKQQPDSAKAQTWWHWMNGNITKEGITADLEAMQRVGLGGAQIFNVNAGIPAGPVKFNSPEWHELFTHAVREADRLGLQLCVHNCAGWSSSGGPWNTPEHAMQRVVTSEVRAKGPAVFDATLPQPPVTLGFYRDIAVLAFQAPPAESVRMRDAAPIASTSSGETGHVVAAGGSLPQPSAPARPKLEIKRAVYEAEDGAGSMDVTEKLTERVRQGQLAIEASNSELGQDPAVNHIKRLRVEYTLDGKPGTVTAAENETLTLPTSAIAGEGEAAKLCDGKSETAVDIPLPAPGKPQWAQLEFREPFPARTVKLIATRDTGECGGVIQISDDGKKFRTVHDFSFGRRGSRTLVLSVGGHAVAAKFWRVQFNTIGGQTKRIALAEIELAPRLTIENIDAKAGFSGGFVKPAPAAAGLAEGEAIPREGIVDLTARLSVGGKLKWDVPPGDWIILRLGYTPTGRNNHPAPAEGTGPECDKFSREALDAHWAGFVQQLIADAGPLAGKSFNNVLVDSYEVGGQN